MAGIQIIHDPLLQHIRVKDVSGGGGSGGVSTVDRGTYANWAAAATSAPSVNHGDTITVASAKYLCGTPLAAVYADKWIALSSYTVTVNVQ